MASIGYGQTQTYVNRAPKVESNIHTLSNIQRTRYIPGTSRKKIISSVEEFLKEPIKYNFSIVTRVPEASTFFKHNCYFDDLETAKKVHKSMRLKLYDQEVSPYLKKIKSVGLTADEKTEVLDIFAKIDALKEIQGS